MRRLWAVLVIWRDGTPEYVADNAGKTALFLSRRKAREMADSFAMGFDEGEGAQSINVVPAPKVRA